jgi:hypothetical protein
MDFDILSCCLKSWQFNKVPFVLISGALGDPLWKNEKGLATKGDIKVYMKVLKGFYGTP